MSDKYDDFREVEDNDKNIIDSDASSSGKHSEDKDEYEKYCYLCRRPESTAGRLIHMPNDIYICQDCMQKTFDGISNGNMQFIDMGKF